MLINLKALVVVLAVATAVFMLARPLCLQFMAERDFARRRNLWLALTVAAFLSPSFWLFALVAMVLLAWGARHDANPLALYLLVLQVIPPLGLDLPAAFVNELFQLDSYRILSFAILLPAAWRLVHSRRAGPGRAGLGLAEGLLLAYCALHLVLLMPHETLTHTLRRGFLFFVDVLLLYYVASRTCTSRHAIVETMACFSLACAILAPLALFEMLKGWLLYEGLGYRWDTPIAFAYLLRGDVLRAQVSAGHALALGYMLVVGFAFCLYLCSRIPATLVTRATPLWMWIGLVAAYSRAPWLAAMLAYLAYLALASRVSAGRSVKALLGAAVVAGAVLASPLGERLIDSLPFVGTVDAGTVAYRERLAERSWELIRENPVFGNPLFITHLEDLRQGQGIIDLVNTYATIAMQYGLVGLCLFLGPYLVGMRNAYRLARNCVANENLSLLGFSLIACMVATLFMMATGGFGSSLEKMFYVLAGLAAGYARLGQVSEGSAAVAVPRLHRSG